MILFLVVSKFVSAEEIHVNIKTGNDKNTGSSAAPIKTLAEAARRVNAGTKTEAVTVFISEGLYPLTETVLFNKSRFSVDNRLTIRAEILPDDTAWRPQRMPLISSVIPGKPAAGDGDESRGIDIEVSHVTIQGIRFSGSPENYYIDGRQNHRYYPVWRDGKSLEDLLVTQCLFAGNADVMPIRVAVIANGHGLVVDHCVFYNCQNSVVFWEAGGGISRGNAMQYCLVYENNYSGVWTTTNTGDDFIFHHNIVANCRTGWIRDKNSAHHYHAENSVFSNNQKFTGNGGDQPISDDFLTRENVMFSGSIEIEKDMGKRNYLQLKEGAAGSEIRAGLFKKK